MKSILLLLSVLAFASSSAQIKLPDGIFLKNVYSEIKADSNIIYRIADNYTGDSVQLHMTIYYPDEKLKFKKPLLILFPPGGFYSSNLNNENIKGIAVEYAGYGYITANVEYRYGLDTPTTALSYEKAIYRGTQDAKTAIKFLKSVASVYCIDTNSVFVGGTSAGSVIALHTAYLNQNEVSDSIDVTQEGNLEITGFAGISSATQGVLNISGAILDKKIMLNETQPIISFHNTLDSQVYFHSGIYKNTLPIFGSQVIDSLAAANEMVHALKPFVETGHGYKYGSPQMDTTLTMSASFFYSLLKNKSGELACTDDLHFNLYPIPVTDYLHIKNENNFFIHEIEFDIYDASGNKIINGLLKNIDPESVSEINVNELARGFYFLRLHFVYHEISLKFLKQ